MNDPNASLKLYSYFRSSASYRVRIALNLKELSYEYIPVHLLNDGGEQRKDSYTKLNPMEQIPTLIDGETVISQSMAILFYIDKKYPENSLFPLEPNELARCLQICEIINSGIAPIQNLSVLQEIDRLVAQPDAKIKWAHDWIEKGFHGLEKTLQPFAGSFCLGGQVSAADLFVVPQTYNARRFNVDMNQFPTISRIEESCLALEAFSKAAPDCQPDTPA